ncbi:MAG: tripartite tricarboxylate transporter TctB family protein [Alphaproteobacteria bacterium]|nr:tripartite tricarboxylate transporter TctB family protein [Alphaproteobacteria bacterium]
MRQAELVMALLMAAFSGYLMLKSAELPIGWIPDEGPGAGAWPFWLSAVMLLACGGIVVNWIRRASPPSRSNEMLLDRPAFASVVPVAVLLTVTVTLFEIAGVYIALCLFMFTYVSIIGRHSFRVGLAYAIVTPVVTFLFFEILIKVILPKGFTEPFFLPIFKFFGMGGI